MRSTFRCTAGGGDGGARLLAAPDQKLALLPAGRASIRRVGELKVSAAGKSQHITCYEISGLGFTPSPVWLDDRHELFASASSWSSVIADGWDSVIPQLLTAQDKWRDEAVSAAASPISTGGCEPNSRPSRQTKSSTQRAGAEVLVAELLY